MDNFNSTVVELYRELEGAGFALPGMHAAAALVPADIAAYFQLDCDTNSAATVTNHEYLTSPKGASQFARWASHEDVWPYWKRAKPGRACTIDDYASRGEFHGTHVYRLFLKELGIDHLVVLTVTQCGGRITGIALGRGNRDFSGSEVAALQQLYWHLTTAKDLSEKLESHQHGHKGGAPGSRVA
jgi:hypothetical protein